MFWIILKQNGENAMIHGLCIDHKKEYFDKQ